MNKVAACIVVLVSRFPADCHETSAISNEENFLVPNSLLKDRLDHSNELEMEYSSPDRPHTAEIKFVSAAVT